MEWSDSPVQQIEGCPEYYKITHLEHKSWSLFCGFRLPSEDLRVIFTWLSQILLTTMRAIQEPHHQQHNIFFSWEKTSWYIYYIRILIPEFEVQIFRKRIVIIISVVFMVSWIPQENRAGRMSLWAVWWASTSSSVSRWKKKSLHYSGFSIWTGLVEWNSLYM